MTSLSLWIEEKSTSSELGEIHRRYVLARQSFFIPPPRLEETYSSV